jgi:HKD family nuclease
MMADTPSFYWNTTANNRLENLLLNSTDLAQLTACCAYLSEYGVELLKKVAQRNNLTKKELRVYLWRDFSQTKSGEILENLCKFAQVKIFEPTFNAGIFHPKLYVLVTRAGERKIIVGSSNLTKGGFVGNIEFNLVQSLDEASWVKLEQGFLGMVDHRSVEVTDEIILNYLEMEPQLNEVKNIQDQIQGDILGIFQNTDNFRRDDYDLTDQFLDYEDYEAFFLRNQLHSLSRVPHREVVQDKFIELAQELLPDILNSGMDLHLHWSRNHWSSLIYPSVYNFQRVTWLGVRFGKHQDEVMRLSSGAEEDEFIGFQKHACLQFSIAAETFETTLFHAVRHDAVDRPHLHEALRKPDFRRRLIETLRPLEGRDCYWIVGGHDSFEFEEQKAEDFPQFYLEVDRDGYDSFLQFAYYPDDERISKENIKATILDDFRLFYPVYQLVAKRY